MEHNFKKINDEETKVTFESIGAELIEFMNKDSIRNKFEKNTCIVLQRLMKKIISPQKSVLSTMTIAHKKDKQVVYDLVNLAVIFSTKLDYF